MRTPAEKVEVLQMCCCHWPTRGIVGSGVHGNAIIYILAAALCNIIRAVMKWTL